MSMKRILRYVFLIIYSLSLTACEEETPRTAVPLVPVEFTINLTLQEYMPLLMVGGYVYIEHEGYKGIIIYKEGNDRYRAIERTCTYQPRNPCEIVSVDDSGFFLIDSCCGSTFDFQGNPTGDPAKQPLLMYNTYLDGHFLTITNTL